MDTQSVLSRLVKIARNTFSISEHIRELGFDDDPYFTIYGNMVEVICRIIGDNTEDVDESATYALIHDSTITEDQCVTRLSEICQFNHPQLSDTTMALVQDAADARGISALTMINVIVGEWALRQSLIRGNLKAV